MTMVSIAVHLPADGYVIEKSTSAPERLTLGRERVYRLPVDCMGIRVVDGTAWLTRDAQDVIVPAGESLTFDGSHSDRILSVAGGPSVTVELLR